MGHRTAGRLLPLLLVLLLFLLISSGTAIAHAELIREEPEKNQRIENAPSVWTLRFSEPVEPAYVQFRILDPDDVDRVQRISVSDSGRDVQAEVGELEPALYTVRWRVISTVDGHTTQGVHLVGLQTDIPEGGPPAQQRVADIRPGETIARALAFTGASLLAGIPAYLVYRFRFVPLKGWLHGPPADRVTREKTLMLIAAGGGLLSTVAVVAMIVSLAVRLDAGISAAITTTTTGRTLAIRSLLLLAATVLAYLSARAARRLPWTATAFSLALAALLVTSLGSHAASTDNGMRPLNIGMDFLHQTAAAAWVSGVLALFITLPRSDSARTAGILVRDFSPFALGAVVVLVLTGVYGGLLHFQNPIGRNAPLTGWEWMLVAKIVLLVPLLALGAWNRYRLQPRLLAGDENQALPHIKRSVKAEVLLMALVLFATGALTHATPPADIEESSEPLPGQVTEYITEDGDRFEVGIQPFPVSIGIQNITVRMVPQDGLPENFRIFLTLHDPEGAETGPFAMERMGEATQWYIRDTLFTQTGLWHAQVLVQGRGYFETFDFNIEVE